MDFELFFEIKDLVIKEWATMINITLKDDETQYIVHTELLKYILKIH